MAKEVRKLRKRNIIGEIRASEAVKSKRNVEKTKSIMQKTGLRKPCRNKEERDNEKKIKRENNGYEVKAIEIQYCQLGHLK